MEEKKPTKQQSEKTPSWLKTIQLNSWEAELLISALVLYALFQIPDFLNEMSLKTFERGSRMHSVTNMLNLAVRLLSAGYILHILVRGIWVASVGLSYVFPKGVNQEKLNFKGNFKKELDRNGSLVKMVLRLEELSSIIYGVSFLFFGTLVGFASLVFSLLFLIELLSPILNNNTYFAGVFFFFILFYLLLCVIMFIDFLTNGYFRRKNWSADWFYYVARFFRIVTLSFLFRRSLLVLISNTKGWKSYLIPFIVLIVTGGFVYVSKKIGNSKEDVYYIKAAQGEYISSNYENTRNSDDRLVATIQADIVHDNTLKVFLKDLGAFKGIYLYESKKIEKGKWDRVSSDSVSLFFNQRLNVSIDETRLDSISWFKTQHPVSNEFGFTSFINISEFDNGPHFLKIGIDTTGMKKVVKDIVEKDDYSLQTISNIYFIYDKP